MQIYLSKGAAGLCLKGGGEREMCAHMCARACMAVQVSCVGPLIIKYSVKVHRPSLAVSGFNEPHTWHAALDSRMRYMMLA
jgi:hypothetical protein